MEDIRLYPLGFLTIRTVVADLSPNQAFDTLDESTRRATHPVGSPEVIMANSTPLRD